MERYRGKGQQSLLWKWWVLPWRLTADLEKSVHHNLLKSLKERKEQGRPKVVWVVPTLLRCREKPTLTYFLWNLALKRVTFNSNIKGIVWFVLFSPESSLFLSN